MRKRICDKCGLEIEYSGNPDEYSRAGSYPIEGDPACTIQAAMEVVEIDGEYLDLCVENGCLDEFKDLDKSTDKDKEKKLKDWKDK